MTKNKQLKFFIKEEKFFHIDDELKKVSSDKITLWGVRSNLLLLFILFALILIFYQRLPLLMPFYYSRPWGPEQLAHKKYLIFLFAFIALISIANFVFSSKMRRDWPVLAKIFIWTGTTVALMALIDIWQIFSILCVW